ncbi:hypothetical protein LWC33_09490 [Pseudonocardia sp. RS11V-5]|uniref:hypothetical protein n=1 Tax=Pseudonocardia terrae TaxID=2905831 RepID=UPI001E2E9FC5|nr:hypothetical protein [Pseudonocardia terrae]MCE3551686.1 hypothetical protein [Pseudonocardia terrae]
MASLDPHHRVGPGHDDFRDALIERLAEVRARLAELSAREGALADGPPRSTPVLVSEAQAHAVKAHECALQAHRRAAERYRRAADTHAHLAGVFEARADALGDR